MQRSSRVFFASSNQHKFSEASDILHGMIDLEFFKCSLQEIQGDSIKEISAHKARQAFNLCNKPVLVEDDGLIIHTLKNFPGPYSSFVFKTIGNKGILKLTAGTISRASFVSVITYCDKYNLESFEAKIHGNISKTIRGRGWGYDPIFVPVHHNKTFAQLDNKNSISHRYKALQKFASWFVNMQESDGQ